MPAQFAFVALEFTSSLGPPPGRYPVATSGPDGRPGQDALLIALVGTPAAQPRLFRRARPADPATPPREVSILRVTWVQVSQPLHGGTEARQLLAAIRPEAERERMVGHAISILNGAIRAYAVAAGDPFATEVSRMDPRQVRVGVASGDQIDAGTFSGAFDCPAPSRGRPRIVDRLRPDEAVVDALTGRSVPSDAELHLLRCLLDIDQGRDASAVLELEAAIDLLIAGIGGYPGDLVAQFLSAPLQRAEALTAAEDAPRTVGSDDVLAATLALIEGSGRVRAAARDI